MSDVETVGATEVLTIEKFIELEKWLKAYSVEPWNGVVFLSRDQWLYARQNGQCDFTDDELNAAVNKSGVIKIGHLKGYDNVHMAINSMGNNVPT